MSRPGNHRRYAHAAFPPVVACCAAPLSPSTYAFASIAHFTLSRFAEALPGARQALELQPDYLPALWVRGLALSGLGRHDEALASLERVATLSRAPFYVGVLGLGYARAGRTDDAKRLLQELEDRGVRGEFVPIVTLLPIHVGLGDIPAVRQALVAAQAESTPAFTLRACNGRFLEDLRSDPEIDRLLFEFYGW